MTITDFSSRTREAARANLGYSQDFNEVGRWSWLDKLFRRIVTGMACDCSSLTMGLYWLAGYKINISGTCATINAADLARDAGFQVLSFTSLSDVREGDALLTPGHHIVPVYRESDGSLKCLSAEYNEFGKATGGKPGDQTGKEVVVRPLYIRSGGWTYILRPPADEATAVSVITKPIVLAQSMQPRFIVENENYWVASWQRIVGTIPDGVLGTNTKNAIKDLQKRLGFTGVQVDGVPGPKTTVRYLNSVGVLKLGDSNPAVRIVQWLVRENLDGSFGKLTESGVKKVQVWWFGPTSSEVDGEVGPHTTPALCQIENYTFAP